MVAATQYILLSGGLIGLTSGFVMHRAEFCLTCSFRDPFLFRDYFMLRCVGLCVLVSMVFFEGARQLGLLSFYPFPFLGPPSVVHAVGGALFGVGMVMSGGCVVGCLYKLGAGRLAHAATLAGLVAGSGLYALFHPLWKEFAAFFSFCKPVTIPQLLGVDPAAVVFAVAVPGAFLFCAWLREGKLMGAGRAVGYLQPAAAAILLAAAGLLSCLFCGMPIGITTSYAKAAGFLASRISPAHFAALPFFQTVPLDVVDPITKVALRGGPAPVLDSVAAVQFPLIGGIFLGSMASAVSLGEFALRWRVPVSQAGLAFAGGVLMGVASRMAAGCNVWHIFGGLPILAMSSLLFTGGILPGAWLGGRIVARIV